MVRILMKGCLKVKLYPKLYLENVMEITEEVLNKNNIKGLILDIDNTLIDYNKNLSEEKIKWAKNLKGQGVKDIVILTCKTENTSMLKKVLCYTMKQNLNLSVTIF